MSLTREQREANVRAVKRAADVVEAVQGRLERCENQVQDMQARIPALGRELEGLRGDLQGAVDSIRRVFNEPPAEGGGGDG